jgi:pyruvate dehydrogenase E2 component (dihydrolipoamide acetyltransferase)
MAISVVMPALEMAQETGKVVRWLKTEGEQVAKGDMLIEVETDKAVVEIEALGEGVLGGITAQEGDVIPVGQTIAWLLQAGEAVPAAAAIDGSQSGRRMDAAAPAATQASASTAAAEGASGRARISPKARRLASDLGVSLDSIVGSGAGGEILADDIRAAAEKGGPKSPAKGGATEPLTSIGRIMADRTTASWTTVPHFFVSRDIDATGLNAARERLISQVEQSHHVKVTHTDLLVAVLGRVLRTHPRLNAAWAADGIAINVDVHVALAMAVENAVVTAVIRNADRASIGDIATQRRELTERARAGRLQPADITGATFTVSNLGMFGVDNFTAIIVPPQAAILAVGAIADKAVAVDGKAVVRPYFNLTLSSDHRVVDGARAAAFMADVASAMQDPIGLIS